MALSDAALVVGSTAIKNAITHAQAHSGARGASGTTNVVGSRVAVTAAAVDADGDITFTAAFTGLNANQAIAEISYWSAATNGTYYGGAAVGSGDTQANAAGAYTANVTENGVAS